MYYGFFDSVYRLIGMIVYKAQDVGISVIEVREDYTSKCSFLDKEQISRRAKYEGERVTRGLYQSKTGILINSDVNGAYNIIKKEIPKAFSQWENEDRIEGVWLHPTRWRMNGVTHLSLRSDESSKMEIL